MTVVDEARTREKPTKTARKAPGRHKAPTSRPRRQLKSSPRPRGSLIAALDIGTTKVCCFIARAHPERPQIIGIGHQVSRGVRNGKIVDLDAAGISIAGAVHAAEEMAGDLIQHIVANLSGGSVASRIIKAEIGVAGREIGESELQRVLEHGYRLREPGDRQIIHSVPVGFSIDDSRGIRDPRGMYGERLGVNMNVVTASAAAVRNHSAAIGRSHLEVEALVVSPYAAGLSCLVEDEIGLGVTVIDMGGGTTTIGVFFDGNLIFADSVPVGGGSCDERHCARAINPCGTRRANENTVRHRSFGEHRRTRDDCGATDRRGRGRPCQSRPEISAGRHHRAADRRNIRTRARPARGQRVRQDRRATCRPDRRCGPIARGARVCRVDSRQTDSRWSPIARGWPRRGDLRSGLFNCRRTAAFRLVGARRGAPRQTRRPRSAKRNTSGDWVIG